MPALYETPRLKPFILAEATGQLSRENIVVTQNGAAVESGQLLARVDTGAGSFAMDSGSTGNPTAGAIVVGPSALPGAYKVVFNSATKFSVEDPNGKVIGTGTLGTAFNKGGLSFALNAGGTAAVDGDVGTLAIAPGTGKYVPYQANGAAGPAEAVNYEFLPAKTGDTKSVGLVRHCELNRFELVGLDPSAEIDLAKRDVIVRGTAGVPGITTPAL